MPSPFSRSDDAQPPRWSSDGDSLLPILSVDDALGDPVALETWYEALTNTIGLEVPHDLLALWLFPIHDAPVLLGPAALRGDGLTIPIPDPYVRAAELDGIAATVRKAGYGSAVCLPIRFGRRDVGMLLVADLHPDRLDGAPSRLLERMTQRLAPTFGRLARLWDRTDHPASLNSDRLIRLIDALGDVNAQNESPHRFARQLSHALEAVIPHDHLELLIADSDGGPLLRLGEQMSGVPWADPALMVEPSLFDVEQLFGTADTMLIADTYADPRWPRGYWTAAEPAGAEWRSLIGVRVAMPHGVAAYVVVGSIGQDFYRHDESELLQRITKLVGPRIESLARASMMQRRRLTGRHPLAAIAELLATTVDPVEGLRLAAEEAKLLLPVRTVRYALRRDDGERVVVLDPAERRPMADLPFVPVADTALGAVIHGEVAQATEMVGGESRLIVPLRMAGRIPGALILSAPRSGAFDTATVTLAQRVADLVAPHCELLRRTAFLRPPYAPGWKRTDRRSSPLH